MTVQAPIACGNEPLFSLFAGEEFSIPISHSAVSFDWSDFPVGYQFKQDTMPIMPSKPSPQLYNYSSPRSACAMELDSSEDTNDTASCSLSDDETVDIDGTEYDIDLEAPPPTSNRQTVVRFSEKMEIRSYPVVLGDHPCCTGGLALELGWDHQEQEVVDFDVYENSRHYQRRRTLRDLRFSYRERKNLLKWSTGLSKEELLLQERQAWAEQLEQEAAARERRSLPKEATLKKVSSTKTLSSDITSTSTALSPSAMKWIAICKSV